MRFPITIDRDTGIYDKVKDFLTQYNALINEITSLYNADSAKGYEPLTDEEKDASRIPRWRNGSRRSRIPCFAVMSLAKSSRMP